MLRSRWKYTVLLAGILLATPLSSQAYNPFASISDYNAVIFNNANAEGGDTEGRLAVGGNLTAKWYGVGYYATPDSSKYSLVVGGDLDAYGQWQVYNGNTAYKGNRINSPSTVEPYTITNTSILDFAAIKAQMQSTSTYLSSLQSNGIVDYDGYNTVTLTGTNANLNVFNMTQEQTDKWASVTSRIINVPTGSTAVINVSGTSGKLSNGMTLNGVSSTNVIFNYYEATSLNISSMALLGSLLAPNAALSLTSANINGIAVVNSSDQKAGGEYHNYGFIGSVPEPSSLVAICAGLGLLVPMLRRKRS